MPTRSQADAALTARIGPLLARVQALLAGPPVADAGGVVIIASVVLDTAGLYADAASVALMACGVTPGDVTNPVDADYAGLAASLWPKYKDVAELQAMESAIGAATMSASVRRWEDYESQRESADKFQSLLDAKRLAVRRQWGWGASTLGAGLVNLQWARCRPEM